MGRVAARLVTFVVSLIVASLIIFSLLNLLPGDVAQVILGANATPEAVAELRESMGLNEPFFARYFSWIGGMLRGDFGNSALNKTPVVEMISEKMEVTWWLVGLSMLLTIVVAIPVGMYSALNRRRWTGFVASTFSQIGMAVPAFLAGLLLVLFFSVHLKWLPAGGYVSPSEDLGEWAAHLVLPVSALALVQSAMMVRFVRSAFIEVINEDYYRTARAFGWTKWKALRRHGLRNASLSIVTVLGLQLATLFVGAIIVEYVMVMPGLGTQLLSSVTSRDLPVVQAIVMLLVFIVLLINLLVDLLYLVLDPRLRTGETEAQL